MAAPAVAISLRDVYDALDEEPLFALPPQPARAECVVGGGVGAVVARFFGGAEAVMSDYLATVSVADLVSELAAASKPMVPRATCLPRRPPAGGADRAAE